MMKLDVLIKKSGVELLNKSYTTNFLPEEVVNLIYTVNGIEVTIIRK